MDRHVYKYDCVFLTNEVIESQNVFILWLAFYQMCH